MAAWWEITFTGDPTEDDLEHVARAIRQGFTSGQLTEADELASKAGEGYTWLGPSKHRHRYRGQVLEHSHPDGGVPHGYYGHSEDGARQGDSS